MTKTEPYTTYCRERQAQNRFRTLRESVIQPHGRVERGGVSYVNLASNDYLGLSQHPALKDAARAYVATFGAGTTASRLITGNHPAYAHIERTLAKAKGKEAALILPTGYQANITVLAALADRSVVGRPVTILADRLAHHSLLQGAALSGARLMRFRHNDYDHLESLLQAQKGAFCLIVSESVFGMDGDRADLNRLGALAEAYNALLYIDEAHAVDLAPRPGIDVIMGTFGKALGSFGAYIACSQSVRDYLVQRCGGLVYSTALPPAILGSISAALDLLPHLEKERAHLQTLSTHLRQSLTAQGWNCGNSTTQILPIIVGEESVALNMAERLKREGFLVPAIRPPTVPPQTSRLRLSISAVHRAEDIERLISVMT